MITICLTVLNNYVGLRECIDSIEKGTLKPDNYCVFDNGRTLTLDSFNIKNIVLVLPDKQVSLACTWNWFVDNVPETRIIMNDDILFYENTLEIFMNGINNDTISFPCGIDRANTYSCFSISNKVINKVGRFDDEFYPAYFEDNSYDYRLGLEGLSVYGIPDCNIIHKGSQTIKQYTTEQMSEHHKCFERNRQLYVSMWGGMPKSETYKTKFNR